MNKTLHALSESQSEDLFIELFSDTFGAEKAGFLFSQNITSMIFIIMIDLPIF